MNILLCISQGFNLNPTHFYKTAAVLFLPPKSFKIRFLVSCPFVNVNYLVKEKYEFHML